MLQLKKFSKLRVGQLKENQIRDKVTGKPMRLLNVIKRYAKIKRLLWVLGFESKMPDPKKTTSGFRQLYRLAQPSISRSYKEFKGKVVRV